MANGIGYALAPGENLFSGFSSPVTGNTGVLQSDFYFVNSPTTLTLTGLNAGTTYEFSDYNAAFGAPSGRFNTITDSQTGSLVYDENATPGSALHDVFTPLGTSFVITYTNLNIGLTTSGDTYHHYAFQVDVVSVPEPASIVMLGLGCLGLLAWRRRA